MKNQEELPLIAKLTLRAAHPDPHIAEICKGVLRDAEEFWRLWHQLPDDLPNKKVLRDQYLAAANRPAED